MSKFQSLEYLKSGFHLFTQKPKKLLLFFVGIWFAAILLTPLPIVGSVCHFMLLIFAQAGAYLLIHNMATTTGDGDWDELKKLSPLSGQLILAQVAYILLVIAGICFLILPGLYLVVSYLFFVPLVTLRGRTFWEALEESRRRVQKHWFAIAGFMLLLLLINLVGAITIIGLLITAPTSACALYFAFQDLVQTEVIEVASVSHTQ